MVSVVADEEYLPFKEDTFDLVVSSLRYVLIISLHFIFWFKMLNDVLFTVTLRKKKR